MLIEDYKQRFFVQHAIEMFVRDNSKVAEQRVAPETEECKVNFQPLRQGRRDPMVSESSSCDSGFSKQSDQNVDAIPGLTVQPNCRATQIDISKLYSCSQYAFLKTTTCDDDKEN